MRDIGDEASTTDDLEEPSVEADVSEYPSVCLDGRGAIAGLPNKG